jgi:hypothetical protein
MYSNGSNTAQKLNSLERQVGNLQETVSYIQPKTKATMRNPGKGVQPLESAVYGNPIIPTNQQEYNDSGQNQSYVPPMPKPTRRPGYEQPYNDSGQNQSYVPQMKIATKKTIRPVTDMRPQGYVGPAYEDNSSDYNPTPQQVPTMMPRLISTYQPPPESTSQDLQSAVSVLGGIQSNINNSLIGPLNAVLSSVGEAVIGKKPTKGGAQKAVTKKATKPVCNMKCAKGYVATMISGKCKCMPPKTAGLTAPSSLQQQMTAASNNIMSQIASLQKGIKTVSSYLPCQPCDSSGASAGGSRVKKSKKTRRNRRS